MQLRRLALVALLVATVAPAVPATAAARKLPCNQVADSSGDGTVFGQRSDTLDIVSADISTGAKQVTATLRLTSTAVENDMYLKGGAIWNFNVTVSGIKYTFYAIWPTAVTLNPTLTGGLTAGSNESNPKATFQRVGNTFLWTVSRAAMPSLAKPKTYIYVTNATSGANSLGGGDSAWAKANTKYLDKTVTCLPSK